jgi:hypothetical protein
MEVLYQLSYGPNRAADDTSGDPGIDVVAGREDARSVHRPHGRQRVVDAAVATLGGR